MPRRAASCRREHGSSSPGSFGPSSYWRWRERGAHTTERLRSRCSRSSASAGASSRRLTCRPTRRAGASRSRTPYLGTRFLTRGGLSRVPETLPRLRRLRGLSAGERAVRLARALDERVREGHTTNVSVVDGEGNACVLDDEPRVGVGRLPAGPRPPPEQHARGDRPRAGPGSARRPDGEHDGPEPGVRRRGGFCSPSGLQAEPGSAARCSRSWPGSSMRASARNRPSRARGSTPSRVGCTWSRVSSPRSPRRSRRPATRCKAGPRRTTTSEASAQLDARGPPEIPGEMEQRL